MTLEITKSADNVTEDSSDTDVVIHTTNGATDRKKKRKCLRLFGGYNVKNPRISILLENQDEFADRIEANTSLATSSLLNIKGYGSQTKL